MHPRNRHHNRYDLKQLMKGTPELRNYVFTNSFGDETLDFSDPHAVKFLNQALLKSYYGVSWWDLPDQYLCPPVPGRADYIHYLADLLGKHPNVLAWDVGVGANCIYPLIGSSEYKWKFIGSEVDAGALASASKIVKENKLEEVIDLRLQTDPSKIFKNIIKPSDYPTVTLCNPPFHSSSREAEESANRKIKNLGLKKNVLNFGGKSNELWYQGGELKFVSQMIEESSLYKNQCWWFTSLISKKENLPPLKNKLKEMNALETKIIEMSQGQKISRILAWTYQTEEVYEKNRSGKSQSRN